MVDSQTQSPIKPSSQTHLRSNDACYNCGNYGHWSKDCPFKTPQKSQPQNPKYHSTSDFPPFPCPKGHGFCFTRKSQTSTNPGRLFYTCNFTSPKGDCGFFKWCDQVKDFELQSNNGNSVNKRDRNQDYPECKCRAGKCKIENENGLQYFVCPITKGHGRCSHRKRVDDTDNVTAVANSDGNDGNQASRLSPKRTKLVQCLEGDPVSPALCVNDEEWDEIVDLSAIDELPLQERKPELRVSRTSSEAVHRRQAEFLRDISDAEDANITGVFPSFDPINVPKVKDECYNVQHDSSQQISTHDTQSGVLLELSSIQNVRGIRQGRDFTTQISKSLIKTGLLVQNQLLAILDSTEPSNHKSMEEAAGKTFTVLHHLSIDHALFSEHIKEFVMSAKSLADIEESMKGKRSLEAITEWYENERAKFDNISRVHAETENAITASDQRLRMLGEESLMLKGMLARIENQLRQGEMENAELKTRAGKILEEMVETERKFHEAKVEKNLLEEMEAERKAAKEALESARTQLRLSVVII